MIDSGSSPNDSSYFNHVVESYDFTTDNDPNDYHDHGISTLSVRFYILFLTLRFWEALIHNARAFSQPPASSPSKSLIPAEVSPFPPFPLRNSHFFPPQRFKPHLHPSLLHSDPFYWRAGFEFSRHFPHNPPISFHPSQTHFCSRRKRWSSPRVGPVACRPSRGYQYRRADQSKHISRKRVPRFSHPFHPKITPRILDRGVQNPGFESRGEVPRSVGKQHRSSAFRCVRRANNGETKRRNWRNWRNWRWMVAGSVAMSPAWKLCVSECVPRSE